MTCWRLPYQPWRQSCGADLMRLERFCHGREINGLTPQERGAVRHEPSRPLVLVLDAWLREQCASPSSKSKVAQAIAYSLTRWAALTFSSTTGVGAVQQRRRGRGPFPDRQAQQRRPTGLARRHPGAPADHPAKRIADLLRWNCKRDRQQKAALELTRQDRHNRSRHRRH